MKICASLLAMLGSPGSASTLSGCVSVVMAARAMAPARRSNVVAGDPPQLRQRADQHTLVVRPGCPAVVDTTAVGSDGEPVVDQVGRVYQATGVEPGPAPMGPVQIFGLPGTSVQPGRGEQEQLIGDGVLVASLHAPPQPTAAGLVPTGAHRGEQRSRLIQVPAVADHLIERSHALRYQPSSS